MILKMIGYNKQHNSSSLVLGLLLLTTVDYSLFDCGEKFGTIKTMICLVVYEHEMGVAGLARYQQLN